MENLRIVRGLVLLALFAIPLSWVHTATGCPLPGNGSGEIQFAEGNTSSVSIRAWAADPEGLRRVSIVFVAHGEPLRLCGDVDGAEPCTGTSDNFEVLEVDPSLHGVTGVGHYTLGLWVADSMGNNSDCVDSLEIEIFGASLQQFRPTRSMGGPRTGHTATALASGELLVTGGWDGQGYRADSEIYDPATGQWRFAAPLQEARSHHSAISLLSGKVLVVGGQNGLQEITAEIYNPQDDSWTPVGKPAPTREGHTTTLLPSGDVLVVGGRNFRDTNRVEIFTPGGLSRLVQPIPGARTFHTATLLRDDRVLVVGGFQGESSLQSAYYFDPDLESWSAAPSLNADRGRHTTTLMANGRVLTAGGTDGNGVHSGTEVLDPEDSGSGWRQLENELINSRADHTATLLPNGEVLAAGGQNGSPTTQAEVFQTESETWFPVVGMHTARMLHTATLLSTGQVLVTGGSGQGGSILSSAEAFDPAPFLWFRGPELSTTKVRHSLTPMTDGRVLAVGGLGSPESPASVEIYDPYDRYWTAAAPLNEGRHRHSATLLADGKILVAGGTSSGHLDTAEIYDPQEDSWDFSATDLADARLDHTATLLPSGEVLVVGGSAAGGTTLATAELFDPDTKSWRRVGSLIHARFRHRATLLPSGKVLVTGGQSLSPSTFLATSEIYDPRDESWTETASLSMGRDSHTATLLPSGQVLVSGGFAGSALADTELYDPISMTWSTVSPMETPRSRHTATLLDNGSVLVTGGYRFGSLRSAEIYDPYLGSWQTLWAMKDAREQHSAVLLPTGEVLVTGGYGPVSGQNGDPLNTVEILQPRLESDRRPVVALATSPIRYGAALTIEGPRLRGDTEASGGGSRSSAADLPLIQLQSLEDASYQWLVPSEGSGLSNSPQSLTVDRLPPGLTPGWHNLRVFASGIPSEALGVQVDCSLVIVTQPTDQSVEEGANATFRVEAQGARTYQWFRNDIEIPGATTSNYTTPPIAASESGASFSVEVDSGCQRLVSEPARLTIRDKTPPEVVVIFPNGGEIFTTSEVGQEPNQEEIRWNVTDDIRVCHVEVSLQASVDGGESYHLVPEEDGGLLVEFGSVDDCPHPGIDVTSVTYELPTEPPVDGFEARYQIQVRATDQALQTTTERSQGHFQIIAPNPDSFKTLILAAPERMKQQMALESGEVDELMSKLQTLAEHPDVQGKVLDLSLNPNLTSLYEYWDQHSDDLLAANQVLFAEGGLHEVILDHKRAFQNLQYIVLVGDDGVIPFARLMDRGFIFTESNYPMGGDLNLDPALGHVLPVTKALEADHYLSDDPIAVLAEIRPEDLTTSLFIPDLMAGRLVETPEEIMRTVDLFIAKGGGMDLTEGDPESSHKVQVTAYDFLTDIGQRVRQHWKAFFDADTPDTSPAPVDGSLIGQGWAQVDLRDRLCGEGDSYSVVNLNGHASHYQEGVPTDDAQTIDGLETREILAPDACVEPQESPLRLNGAIVYSVGCHGGLPIRGSDPFDVNHSLDLPQTILSAGALAYLSNSGYGWGLKFGIGYSERLVQIFTELLTNQDKTAVGEAFRQAKLDYFLESPYFDSYDEKTLMQWTFYGLPMYSLRVRDSLPLEGGTEPVERIETELFFEEHGTRNASDQGDPDLPDYVVSRSGDFNASAEGIYSKHTAYGEPMDVSSPCESPEGCYYEFNRRSTSRADLPIEPLSVTEARDVATSLHGVLWQGGSYGEETGWKPVFGEPVSNGGTANPGPLPRHILIEPISTNPTAGSQGAGCRGIDTEPNIVAVTTGELLKENPEDPTFNRHRLFQTMDLELFYFNNFDDPEQNCDRVGPQVGAPTFGDQYHSFDGQTLMWEVPASDEAGVWRVVAVHTDGVLDSNDMGYWELTELQDDGTGTWTGTLPLDPAAEFTYVLQMVDNRGNVSWLRREVATPPLFGGTFRNLPRAVDVRLDDEPIFQDGFETGDFSRWSSVMGN